MRFSDLAPQRQADIAAALQNAEAAELVEVSKEELDEYVAGRKLAVAEIEETLAWGEAMLRSRPDIYDEARIAEVRERAKVLLHQNPTNDWRSRRAAFVMADDQIRDESAAEADLETALETFGPLGKGSKHDDGKLPLHLLPVDALEAITEILDFGARKYAPRNWEKGLDWSRVYRAAIGHLFKWWACAGPDEETGKSHLWHAGCCILFLIAYEIRSVGKDDRPKNTA